MKRVLVLLGLLLLVPALAADLTLNIDSLETSQEIIEEEHFSLRIQYSIFNTADEEKEIDDLELDLELPDTVTGTLEMDLPTVTVPAEGSITEHVVVQNLEAEESGRNQQIKIRITGRDGDINVVRTLQFDITESTTFTLKVVSQNPSVGEWVELSGDVRAMVTEFVGKDAEGNDVLIQEKEEWEQMHPQQVLIHTPWKTYTTWTNTWGTFHKLIYFQEPGEHNIVATTKDDKTAVATLRDNKITLQAHPQNITAGDIVTLIGRVKLPGLTTVPVEITIDGTQKTITTNSDGIFQTKISPQNPGNVKVKATLIHNGQYASDRTTIQINPVQEKQTLHILPSIPTQVLAGTTAHMEGTIMKKAPTPAILTIRLPTETKTVNSTDGSWSLNFVAPQEPGFYPLTIKAVDREGHSTTEQVELKVMPFTESIIQINPDQAQYSPRENATIKYKLDLSQPIETEAHIRVKWYGKIIYEETRTFQEKLNGSIQLRLDPGDYEAQVEALGNIKTAKFQAYTQPETEETPKTKPIATVENKWTIPLLIGAGLVAIVALV